MSQIIQKGKELIRINPSNKNEIQYSVNNGENWNRRSLQSDDFTFLLDCGEELLAITKNGKQISYSKNNGENWFKRGVANSSFNEFHNLTLNGSEILAITDKGLYYSRNKGENWNLRN